MNDKLKIPLVITGIGIFGLIAIGRASFAQPSVHSPVAILQQKKQAIATDLGDGDGETNDDLQDRQESDKLQPLAKITPQQAQQAAEAKQGGKASSVKLENEHGSLVYAVVIDKTEVTVNADNGRIISIENN